MDDELMFAVSEPISHVEKEQLYRTGLSSF